MAIDWNKITESFLTNTGPILLALAGFFKVLQKNQKVIKKQLDGHTKMLVKAKRAEGKLEGIQQGHKDVKQDLVDVVKTVQKRGARRATDKS